MRSLFTSLLGLAAFATLIGTSAQAEEQTLRLSTLMQPDSEGHRAAEDFARRVAEKTDGRIEVQVYPGNQLGDWVEVHQQVMQGAIELAMQPLSNEFDKRLAIAWFPYLVADYDEASVAFSADGYVHEIVDDIVAEQDLKLLGVWGAGMGGAGFAKSVDNPTDPDADHGMKIRVWPGGTTHRYLMERFGFNAATVPWAELYTAMQTGVVDGQIGGTPELAVQNFKDITKTWIQYNDHFEPAWFVVNRSLYESLPEEDQKALIDAAQEVTVERFEGMKKSDQENMEILRNSGADVVTLDQEALAKFVAVAREEVWPQIGDELGPEIMERLHKAVDSGS